MLCWNRDTFHLVDGRLFEGLTRDKLEVQWLTRLAGVELELLRLREVVVVGFFLCVCGLIAYLFFRNVYVCLSLPLF